MTLLSRYRKLIAAIIGIAGSALSAGLVPSPESRWITAIIGALGVAGVYTVKNATPTKAPNGPSPPTYSKPT